MENEKSWKKLSIISKVAYIVLICISGALMLLFMYAFMMVGGNTF